MKIVHVENHRHDHLVVKLTFRRGGTTDPPALSGRAWVAGKMLLRGTRHLSEEYFQEELDFLGSNLDVGIGAESFHLIGDCRRETWGPFMDLMSEALLHPSLLKPELKKFKRNHLESIRNSRDSDSSILMQMVPRLLFERHPYGRPVRGEEAELPALTVGDLKTFHRGHLARDVLIVGVAGDATAEEVEARFAPLAAQLPAAAPPHALAPPDDPGHGLEVLLVERPGRTQAQVGIARRAAPGSAADLVPLVVFNTAFGDTFTAPLVREIREIRGWSYGVESSLLPGRLTGVHFMHYAPSNEYATDAIALGLQLLSRTLEDGPTAEDVEFAKSWLINHFPFNFDTASKRLDLQIQMALTGRDSTYLDRFVERVRAVCPEDARLAAQHHLENRRVVVVVVGDPSLADSLSRLDGLTRMRRVRYDHSGPLPD
ncbi:MAG: pitrilysin family protein [Pseudomonadota bacterium]